MAALNPSTCSRASGIAPARGSANPASYLLVLLWLALCQAFFTPSASPLVEQGSHVDGGLGVATALAPTDDPFVTLRRAHEAPDDPPDQNPDPAEFYVFTLPVLVLAAACVCLLRHSVPLPALRRSASPRAPPRSLLH